MSKVIMTKLILFSVPDSKILTCILEQKAVVYFNFNGLEKHRKLYGRSLPPWNMFSFQHFSFATVRLLSTGLFHD